MLLVSRYVGVDRYGVVDTDDGVEEVVTWEDIVRICGHLRIPISGVDTRIRTFSFGDKCFVDRVRVFQDGSTRSPLQAKTLMLKHVDVTTFGDMVTSVVFDYSNIKEPPVIRLSDFGSRCGDRILYGNPNRGVHKITLILDDKIEFTPKTFSLFGKEQRWSVGTDGVGVLFDIHELHDEYKAMWVYKSLMIDEVFDELILESVIDSDERKHCMFERFVH